VSKAQRAITAEIEKLHETILDALDELFVHEVPKGPRRLRLVWPAVEAIDRDEIGIGLRALIRNRGRDLWAYGGMDQLFRAMHEIAEARPERRMWDRMQLMALWADIGVTAERSPVAQPELRPAR
jgi:hypothetical protein